VKVLKLKLSHIMNVSVDKNNFITYSFIGIAALAIFTFNQNSINQANAAKLIPVVEAETENNSVDDSAISILQQNRPLRMSISVDNPSFLKVKVGQEIKKGDVISDNSTERDRLLKQKQSVTLQIDNLKSKTIPEPFKPALALGLKPLPPAIFSEESAAIAQGKMKLSQAQGLLEARTQLLQTDNPERRAESENAEAGFQIASQKVQEQEQMIQSMRDMKLSTEILQHEEAKLKQLRSLLDQASSALDQAKAKLNASAILQQQELQQLQINVRLAQSDLEVAESKLVAAQNRRQLTEYDANLNEARRQQQENQTQQEYSRQQQQYAQSVRDRDYQLAQLAISLTNIEDKLALIPMLRSPRNGYIRRIKPWTGVNGKYTTTITISAAPAGSSLDAGSTGTNKITNPNSKTTNKNL
jgi:DNA polymerase III alpha subunit (gram-positive type)